MRTKQVLYILVIFLWSSIAQAQLLSGLKAKEAGDLGLIIVASETAKYIQDWISTPPESGVTIKRLRTAKPNQLIVTAFLVTGLAPSSEEKCILCM
jgi:hypothetical protein